MCLWLGLTNNLPTHLVNYVILVNRGILYWHPETASSNVSFGTDKIRDKEKKTQDEKSGKLWLGILARSSKSLSDIAYKLEKKQQITGTQTTIF